MNLEDLNNSEKLDATKDGAAENEESDQISNRGELNISEQQKLW